MGIRRGACAYTAAMRTVALVTAVAATGHDDDLVPLLDACADAGLHARAVAWDDPTVNWGRFDTVLLRSPWDYTERLPEFLAWAERVDRATLLLNPLNVVRWNTDKHYLADLAAVGIPTVPTTFVEPDAEPMEALSRFLNAFADADEFVVKPTVSAGARDTQRYQRDQQFAAGNHIARLLDQDRSVMLQPYVAAVDAAGPSAKGPGGMTPLFCDGWTPGGPGLRLFLSLPCPLKAPMGIALENLRDSLTLGLIRHGKPVRGPAREVAKTLHISGIGLGTPALDFLGVPLE